MTDRRRANVRWTVCADGAETISFDGAQLAVLMDIRGELQEANATLAALLRLAQCSNVRRGFIAMHKLRQRLAPAKAKPKKRAAVRRRKRRSA